jgi:hypothetical protein
MKEGLDVSALKSKLRAHERYSRGMGTDSIYSLEGRDDVVVRSLNWMQCLGKQTFHPHWEGKDISAEEFAQITKQHFDLLRTYGVDAPVSFFVGEAKQFSQPQEEVFAVVANVEKNPHPNREALGHAFAQMRSSTVHYYADRYEANESFLADLFPSSQYVYGRKAGDGADHLYLVDVEPFIYRGKKAFVKTMESLQRAVAQEAVYFDTEEYREVVAAVEALHQKARM